MVKIHRHLSQDDILTALTEETGKDLEGLRSRKGELRQIAMELLYRAGGLKGPEIGEEIFGVDYTSVSQERRGSLTIGWMF
jgi:putative transposase